MIQKGIKLRIYPNKEQEKLIHKIFGCCRFVYNEGLVMRSNAYKNGEKIGYVQTTSMLTQLKKCKDFEFLKDADSVALQQSLRDLDRSFTNFFQKRTSYPSFKSKRNHNQSYRTICQNNNIRIIGKRIKLPKLGLVKIRQAIDVEKINSVTVRCTPSGKYFAVLNVDFQPRLYPNSGDQIGIDVGIMNFYTDSNGNTVSNPKYLERSIRKLSRAQHKLSRKQKGSKNRNKQRIKVALIHEKIVNQRNDFLQKHSTMLIRENQTICIEELEIKQMMHDNKLAKNIASASWGKFINMLTYKSIWYGNDLIKIPNTYPSSQLCSCCGYKNKLVKKLKVREWRCPRCHSVHNRDINASINLLNKGLQLQLL